MSATTRSRQPVDCSAVHGQLEAFVLEELSPRDAARIEQHLVRCASCRDVVASHRDLFALVPQALEPHPPPPGALLEVLRRVRSGQRSRRSWSMGFAVAASAAIALLAVLAIRPIGAASLARALESPEIAVINLFVALDSPLTSRYEYRTAADVRFENSVGRMLFNVTSGEWRLLVHGLPRPPHGARYVLSAQVGEKEVELGAIEPWVDGVAKLSGRAAIDLTRTERLSLQLVSAGSRLRLLEAVDGAW